MAKALRYLAQGALLAGASLLLGSCSNEYTYFTVNMNLDSSMDKPSRDQIGDCVLKITADGKEVDQFPLPLTTGADGRKYGCAAGSTGTWIGALNYSSIRPAGAKLTFTMIGRTDEGANSKQVVKGTADENTSPGSSKQVEIKVVKDTNE